MKAKKSLVSAVAIALLALGSTPAVAGPPKSSSDDYKTVSSEEVYIDLPGYSGPGVEYTLVPTSSGDVAARGSCTVTVLAGTPYKYNGTTGAATAWVTVDSSCTTSYTLTHYLKRGKTTRGSATKSFLPGSNVVASLLTVSCITTGTNTWYHVANVSPNPSASLTCY